MNNNRPRPIKNSRTKSSDRKSKEDTRLKYYREVVFILYGIVLAQSFFLISNKIVENDIINGDVMTRWIFVNTVIIASWISYMQVITKIPYRPDRGTLTLSIDIIILFEYHILISVIHITDPLTSFIDIVYVMLIIIFFTYFIMDVCHAIRIKYTGLTKLFPSNILRTAGFFILVLLQHWVYAIMTDHTEYFNRINIFMANNFEWESFDNTIMISISIIIIILYQMSKMKYHALIKS